MLLPDIQWDGHNGVEDDDVGPEGEEARKHDGALNVVPGQKHFEVYSDAALPNSVPNSQNSRHTNEEGKDLKYKSSFNVDFYFFLLISFSSVKIRGLISVVAPDLM